MVVKRTARGRDASPSRSTVGSHADDGAGRANRSSVVGKEQLDGDRAAGLEREVALEAQPSFIDGEGQPEGPREAGTGVQRADLDGNGDRRLHGAERSEASGGCQPGQRRNGFLRSRTQRVLTSI